MSNFPPKFKEIYEEYYSLHSDATLSQGKLHYLDRQWIFPNHIDVMLELVIEFRERFCPEANLNVALFAALLHDAGLVYKRTSRSPEGHEGRSCEYATFILQKHGFDDAFIQRVCAAISSTEPEIIPRSDEAILVRNADAYSHLSTMHFFAKAHFAEDLTWYIGWFDKKVHVSLKKLTIPELVDEKKPLVKEYERLLQRYHKYQHVRFVDSNI